MKILLAATLIFIAGVATAQVNETMFGFARNWNSGVTSEPWEVDDLLRFLEISSIVPIPDTSPSGATITVDIPGLPADARPMRLVRIPAGDFQMGSPDTERGRDSDEGPVHRVTINYDFYIGETEVTQAQWKALMGSNPATDLRYPPFGVGNDYPVYYVSWDDIAASFGFLSFLNSQSPYNGFRLPSEAEWEYACRAGTQTRFFFGDNLSCDDQCGACSLANQYMWWCGNYTYGSEPVGSKLPNAFHLYDMHGNVWEWCQDYWHENYNGAPSDGSSWLLPNTGFRILRGGYLGYYAASCRSAMRDPLWGEERINDIGFRVVLPVSP